MLTHEQFQAIKDTKLLFAECLSKLCKTQTIDEKHLSKALHRAIKVSFEVDWGIKLTKKQVDKIIERFDLERLGNAILSGCNDAQVLKDFLDTVVIDTSNIVFLTQQYY